MNATYVTTANTAGGSLNNASLSTGQGNAALQQVRERPVVDQMCQQQQQKQQTQQQQHEGQQQDKVARMDHPMAYDVPLRKL